MTSQVKLPYYPNLVVTEEITRLGVPEISSPRLYDQPLKGITIIRVDALECLRSKLGDNCFIDRNSLYKLCSGACSITEHERLFDSFYRRYKTFTAIVNDIYRFGDLSETLMSQVISMLRYTIDDYHKDIQLSLLNDGGKYLVYTHDYLYMGFKSGVNLPDIAHAVIVKEGV